MAYLTLDHQLQVINLCFIRYFILHFILLHEFWAAKYNAAYLPVFIFCLTFEQG